MRKPGMFLLAACMATAIAVSPALAQPGDQGGIMGQGGPGHGMMSKGGPGQGVAGTVCTENLVRNLFS